MGDGRFDWWAWLGTRAACLTLLGLGLLVAGLVLLGLLVWLPR